MSDEIAQSTRILGADPGRAAQARITELTEAFHAVIQNGYFILGKQVELLERSFSLWQNACHAIGVANGTDALELCLRASGIGCGDLVIVPTHTAVATATAICRAGAVPLLVDIQADSFNLDIEQVESLFTQSDVSSKIKAIVPVHLYGNPCDMAPLLELASTHRIAIIEDCSQAHGAEYQGKKVGGFGDASAFSCYPTKNLGALGDAGFCVTQSEEIANNIRLLRQYGWKQRYVSDEIGMNSRLDELHAALLSVQLKYLDDDLARREYVARRYSQALSSLPITLPRVADGSSHAWHQFTILTDSFSRDPLREHLQSQGVYSSVLYPVPIHLQPAYHHVATKFKLNRSVSESTCERLLCLPIHAFLTDDEVTRVVDALQSYKWK